MNDIVFYHCVLAMSLFDEVTVDVNMEKVFLVDPSLIQQPSPNQETIRSQSRNFIFVKINQEIFSLVRYFPQQTPLAIKIRPAVGPSQEKSHRVVGPYQGKVAVKNFIFLVVTV